MRNFVAQKVVSMALDRPNNASFLQIDRIPMYFRVEDSAVSIGDGPHGAVGLVLFKRTTKPSMLASQYTRNGG